jgi:hypothetical protein
MDNYYLLRIIKKQMKKIVVISLLLVTFIISIQSKEKNEEFEEAINPAVEMISRFVYSGDIYWYAYPDNIYKIIPPNRPLEALFGDFLGLFRLYDWDELPSAIGLTLKRYHHPSDVISGSNARHNVFGLIYFGFYGSILFSFLIGVSISFVRNRLAGIINYTFVGGGIFTYLILKTSGFDTDPTLTLSYLNNLLVIFPVLFIGYLLIVEFLKPNSAN